MRSSERRVAMLREMGVRVWPVAGGGPPGAAPSPPQVGRETTRAVDAGPATDQAVAAAAASPQTERPGGVAAWAWGELREAVSNCTACKLCKGRRQTVFGTGNEHAHWMVVGEAPGEQEDLQGEPFVGKSGQLLDNMLRALELTRQPGPPEQQVFIANAVKCRPPANRNPEPDELAACEPFLVRQLQLVQPRIILAMGRVAAHTLLRSTEPIGRLRGRVHAFEGVALVVTYHPAYLLRNPQDKARAWDDLCLAWRTVRGSDRSTAR
jgi:DNA polymerase